MSVDEIIKTFNIYQVENSISASSDKGDIGKNFYVGDFSVKDDKAVGRISKLEV